MLRSRRARTIPGAALPEPDGEVSPLRFLRRTDPEKTERAVEKSRTAWFGGVAALFRRGRLDEALWDDLEELLISADVGVATTGRLLDRVRDRVRAEGIIEPGAALDVLKEEMVGVLERAISGDPPDLEASSMVLIVVGVNGGGKTTSIAKLAHRYVEGGRSVLLAAADTYRAAAIDQLQAWGSRLNVEVVAHQPGADPGAVAFDSLRAARARSTDVVIIDTAGRLHTKANLMEELKKVLRVVDREGSGTRAVLLTLDATTGQNGVIQARSFMEAVSCDGVFLSKLDGTAKGGVVLAIADELGLPVLYIGTGEGPTDMAAFDPREYVETLLTPA